MLEELYKHQVLKGAMRGYVMSKVKKPLMKAIIVLANRYPEPTKENCPSRNVHELMDIRDEFLGREENPNRIGLFEALFRIFIAEYAHDTYYRFRIDWLKERWGKSPWTRPNRWEAPYWKEHLGVTKRGYL